MWGRPNPKSILLTYPFTPPHLPAPWPPSSVSASCPGTAASARSSRRTRWPGRASALRRRARCGGCVGNGQGLSLSLPHTNAFENQQGAPSPSSTPFVLALEVLDNLPHDKVMTRSPRVCMCLCMCMHILSSLSTTPVHQNPHHAGHNTDPVAPFLVLLLVLDLELRAARGRGGARGGRGVQGGAPPAAGRAHPVPAARQAGARPPHRPTVRCTDYEAGSTDLVIDCFHTTR